MSDKSLKLPLGPLMVDVMTTSLSMEDVELLCQPAVGAVILFSRNFESLQQISELIRDIKQLRAPSLLVAVDQEGGRVQRFQGGFFRLPAMHSFSKIYDAEPERGMELTESAGYLMAAELLETGLDFSFAPVLDCANPQSKVIGDRGFHEQPNDIVNLAGAFIEGLNNAGMAATGKHFPGHGGVIEDSHFELPIDHRSLSELETCDLIPYRALAEKLGGIMTAHVAFPNIEESLPTFSSYWLDTVLRKEIGFNGLIFSDDLTMKGAHGAGSLLQRTRVALEAGCDMALICNDSPAACDVARQLGSDFSADQIRLEAMRASPASVTRDYSTIKKQLSGYV
jgi:beta-N-acetylhexosaminidase